MRYNFLRSHSGLLVPHTPAIHTIKNLEGQVDHKVGVSGHFTVELIDAKTQRVKRRLEFDNIVTDAGLVAWIQNANFGINNFSITYAAVGTGSTTPSSSDTALVAEISPASSNRTSANGSVSDTQGYTSGTDDYHWHKHTYLFVEAQGNGNLTEIGLWNNSSGGSLWCRQLFKDVGGTPTTITKTSSDQLRVTYEIRIYPPTADVTNTISISSTSYDYTVRPCNVNVGSSAWDNSINGSFLPGGTQATYCAATNTLASRTGSTSDSIGADTNVLSSYAGGGALYREYTAKYEPGNSAANALSGIGRICTNPGGSFGGGNGQLFQTVFSPKFAKTNLNRLTLVFRTTVARRF